MKLKLFFVVFVLCFFGLGVFLDITKPPKKADVIVCLGGSDVSRTLKSIKLLKNGYSLTNKLIYSGDKKHFSKCIKNMQKLKNISDVYDIKYITGLKNTMAEIQYINKIVRLNHYHSVLIVTSPWHSRRVDFMIQEFATPLDGKYIIVSSNSKYWNKYLYFFSMKAIGLSFLEVLKLLFNYIKYSLPPSTHIAPMLDKMAQGIKYFYHKYVIVVS
jgi:hypothetical protein